MSKSEKSYFGITKVTGSLRSVHRYPVKDDYVQPKSNQQLPKELDSEETDDLVYDFRGSYPIGRVRKKLSDQIEKDKG